MTDFWHSPGITREELGKLKAGILGLANLPADAADFTSYYGPTAWDNEAGKQWHHNCPDTAGTGHDGEVWYWKDSGATCTGCKEQLAPEG